jgi:hypothetical protein
MENAGFACLMKSILVSWGKAAERLICLYCLVDGLLADTRILPRFHSFLQHGFFIDPHLNGTKHTK